MNIESGLVESGSSEIKDHHGVFQRKTSQRKYCRGCGEGFASTRQQSIRCFVLLGCEENCWTFRLRSRQRLDKGESWGQTKQFSDFINKATAMDSSGKS